LADGLTLRYRTRALPEHEHVSVTAIKAAPAPDSPQLDIAYLENLQADLFHAGPTPGIEEVAATFQDPRLNDAGFHR